MHYRVEWLLLLGCVACGGHTVGSEPQPPARPDSGGSSAGKSSSPDTPSQGGTSSQPESEPEPEPEPEPTCSGPQPVCLPDCASLDRVFSECDGLTYRCPTGWVDLDSCPKDACARRSQSCCSATGHTETPDCKEDGTIGDCPKGFTQKSVCVPEGLGISDCSELNDGTTCASAELTCFTGRCSRNCYCNPDAAGVLKWQCWVNAC